jgi:hypothetical protein
MKQNQFLSIFNLEKKNITSKGGKGQAEKLDQAAKRFMR